MRGAYHELLLANAVRRQPRRDVADEPLFDANEIEAHEHHLPAARANHHGLALDGREPSRRRAEQRRVFVLVTPVEKCRQAARLGAIAGERHADGHLDIDRTQAGLGREGGQGQQERDKECGGGFHGTPD